MAEETTQGTTGGRYLTKDYLVRNLQNFWSKIKNYITENIKDFATETYVNRAVDTAVDDKVTQTEFGTLQSAVSNKAEKSELDTLKNTVSGKADASTLTALDTQLTEALRGKVDKVSGKGLSTHDFTTELKNKLDSLSEGSGGIEVDIELNETSENPIANAPVAVALSGKVDKVMKANPQNLLKDSAIVCSADTNGHITIDFPEDAHYVKIHTAGGTDFYRPIEKMVITQNSKTIFTNFEQKDNKRMSVTMENPEGKNASGNWIITPGKEFTFYVEHLKVDRYTYEPFMIHVARGNNAATATILDVRFTNTVVTS